MGPQDQKWRSMYYDTTNKMHEPKKLVKKFEEHISHIGENMINSPGYGQSDQFKEIKRQNDFLKNYSIYHISSFKKTIIFY